MLDNIIKELTLTIEELKAGRYEEVYKNLTSIQDELVHNYKKASKVECATDLYNNAKSNFEKLEELSDTEYMNLDQWLEDLYDMCYEVDKLLYKIDTEIDMINENKGEEYEPEYREI